jgi:hypothetical protein
MMDRFCTKLLEAISGQSTGIDSFLEIKLIFSYQNGSCNLEL